MRMVEAIPNPNTKAIRRNMTMLALEVAASASSPRKRPTQTALIDPFRDCRIEEPSVGKAKASKVGAIRPEVRSRWPACGPRGGPAAGRAVESSAMRPLSVIPVKAGIHLRLRRKKRWIPDQVRDDG